MDRDVKLEITSADKAGIMNKHVFGLCAVALCFGLTGCNSGGQSSEPATPASGGGVSSSSSGSIVLTTPIPIGAEQITVEESEKGQLRSIFGSSAYAANLYSDQTGEAFTSFREPLLFFESERPRDVPESGTATMTGTVEIATIERAGAANGQFQFDLGKISEDITLTADFDNATLTGSSRSLSVDGTYSGNKLSGTVEHDGIEANLKGFIGARRSDRENVAHGHFAGHDNRRVKAYSGAFVVEGPTD